MNETTPAVRAEGLVKSFGEQRAVDHVDLEVRRGEVFGVLGPNGAGKTTMLKMLATLLPIDGGRVIRLAARSRRRRMPPENAEMGLLAASVRSNCSSSVAAVERAVGLATPWSRAKSMRFSVAVRFSSTEAYCPVTPSS